MYNPKSLKAEEFISDEEIRETLAYADANKENVELIDQILAKAKECKGLTHREASVLLPVQFLRKFRRCMIWQRKSRKNSTETELFCLRLCICLTIV